MEIAPNKNITDEYAPRYVAIKLLEDDRIMKEQLVTVPNYACMLEVAQKEIQRLEKEYKEDHHEPEIWGYPGSFTRDLPVGRKG